MVLIYNNNEKLKLAAEWLSPTTIVQNWEQLKLLNDTLFMQKILDQSSCIIPSGIRLYHSTSFR